MQADYLRLVRLLKIEPCEIPFKFSDGKPRIEDPFFDIVDSLILMDEKINQIFPTMRNTLALQNAAKLSISFLDKLETALADYDWKKREAMLYRQTMKRNDDDGSHAVT